MALRGERPSLEELARVEDDADALPELVSAWLETDAFGATLRDMHAELLLVRDDHVAYQTMPNVRGLEGRTSGEVMPALHDEPLRLAQEVVMSGSPYTEILTADWMMANDVVAYVWGLDYDAGGPDWQRTTWSDGRPAAGVLGSSAFIRRHESAGSNFHRGRAAHIAATFLCDDLRKREIEVNDLIDLNDEFAVAHAVQTDSGCLGCHATLEPMAAFYWGFPRRLKGAAAMEYMENGCSTDPTVPRPLDQLGLDPDNYCYPLRLFTPAFQDDWSLWDLPHPAYYGQPGEDLSDLGRMMAADPQFHRCAAQRFYSYFTQTPLDEIPSDTADELQSTFTGSGFDAKDLVAQIVLDDRFLSTGPEETGAVGLQVVRPEQYARLLEQVLGFRWESFPGVSNCGSLCWGRVDLLNSDMYGFRTLMGGVAGTLVMTPSHTASPTKMLATERVAFEAAAVVIQEESFAEPDQRRLLTLVDPRDPDDPNIRAQLQRLCRLILGVEADPAHLHDLEQLFDDGVEEHGISVPAWISVVAVLLQDPRVVFY
jgi:hypothetical protein